MRCETPNCGAEIPLLRSFWLCKKPNRKRALKCKVIPASSSSPARREGEITEPKVEFEIFEPKSDQEVLAGTVTRAKATCLCCGTVLSSDRVRSQLSAQQGGADVVFNNKGNRVGGARLLAVVTLNQEIQGRRYRSPTRQDYEAIWKAEKRLEEVGRKPMANGLSPIPDEPIHAADTRNFWVTQYGPKTFGELFTARQKLSLITVVRETELTGNSVQSLLGSVISRCADYWSSGAMWAQEGEFVAHTFGRQALPIVWDFAEVYPWGDGSGNFAGAVDWVCRVADVWVKGPTIGQMQVADACSMPLPDDTNDIWFTDPPYYDAVPYADLSDFFFVWLKRALPRYSLLHDPHDPLNPLTPKVREIVQNVRSLAEDGKPKGREFYEMKMAKAFAEGRRILKDNGAGCVVFAHKTTEGWEALLSGMIKAGWTVTCSWPIATERPGRLRSQNSAALATVCSSRLPSEA